MILLSSGLGAVPGAFLWGWVADRIGRRKAFIREYRRRATEGRVGTKGNRQMAMLPGQEKLVIGPARAGVGVP